MSKYRSLKKSTRSNILSYGIVILAFAILFPMQQTHTLSYSLGGQLVPICAYIVMALSLNLTVGVLGELSLGHAGFMSVGAFSGAIASTVMLESGAASGSLRLVVAIIVGAFFAAIAGLIIGIPVLRLRGDYLAIVTLAFGEIIKNVIGCLYVSFDTTDGLQFSLMGDDLADTAFIAGPNGATMTDKTATFTAGIVLILITLFVVQNFVNSHTGRAVRAIRDNRIAAESVGVSITRYKLTAFITSAALAGMAGAFYGQNFIIFDASKFDFNTSILILVFVVLGGMGNMLGTIIATTVLYILPEMLRQFSDYRMLIYAIVLILVMLITNGDKAKNFVASAKRRFSKSAANTEVSENG